MNADATPAMRHLSKRRTIAVIAAVVAITALLGYTYMQDRMPSWIVWEEKTLPYNNMSARLEARCVTLFDEHGNEVTHTPSEWRIQSFCVNDANRDGEQDLVLLAWRRGRYGTSKPFWVTDDPKTWSQHIFIVDVHDGSIQPLWMSSGVGTDVVGIDKGESGHLFLTNTNGERTAWEWESWGFGLMDSQNAQSKDNETASILVTGDIIAHESLYEQAWDSKTQEFDFKPMFEQVRNRVSSYDVAVASQETVFVHDDAQYSGYPFFGTPEALGDALQYAGYDVVCCATNHAADKDEQGVADTLTYWKNHPDITVVGMHGTNESSVRIIDANGYTIALLDATTSLNGRSLPANSAYTIDTLEDEQRLIEQLREAATQADFTLCLLHMGNEYASQPTTDERAVAQRFADAGADAIVCTHPHVVQSTETIMSSTNEPCIVYWSLGNLLSHQTDPRTVIGGAAELVLDRNNDGSVYVRSHTLLHSVSHVEPGYTAAYFLDDYTEKLARRHFIDYMQWY